MEFENKLNSNDMIIGLLGCGKIGQAVVRGYAGASQEFRPKQVTISLTHSLSFLFHSFFFLIRSLFHQEMKLKLIY